MVMILSLCACSGTRSTPTGGGSSEKAQAQTDSAEEKQEAAEPAAEAAETPAGADGDYTVTYKSFGMTVRYPEQFANTKGTFDPREGSELEPGINALSYYYAAMPKETYTNWMTSGDIKTTDTYCDVCIVLQKQ